MSSMLDRLGRLAARHPWRVLAAWIALAVATVMLSSAYGGSPDDDFSLPGAESQRGMELIEERFPQQTLFTSNVVFHSEDGLARRDARAAIGDAVQQLRGQPHVLGVTDPYDPAGSTLSRDGTTAYLTVAFDTDAVGEPELTAAKDATRAARDAGLQVEYDGGLGYAEVGEEPSSELIAIGVAVVVLVIAFGSLVAMSLPLVVALVAIGIGSSLIGLLAGFVTVPQIATIIGLMLGLGVGIDYALFVLARHRQNLEAGMSVEQAVGRANATAGVSVVFAGLTVVVAIAGVQLSGIPMIGMMGWGAAIMVAVTMLAAITLLPALLGLVGRRVNSLRVPFVRSRTTAGSTLTARWAAHVVTKPARYAVGAALVLAVLAAPTFAMRLGFADAGTDAPTMTTRKAYDLVSDAYGAGVNGPLQVVVEPGDRARFRADLSAVRAALSDTAGVASVSPPTVNPEGTLGVVAVVPDTGPQDARTSELVTRLRADVLPDALQGSQARSSVTGMVAVQDDVSRRLADRMPVFLAAVIALSFLVLMLLFRSVLVPLKAAVLNVLSVGASYGVVVAVFQWGWAADLIGVHEAVPIMALAPMLMFAILFGLSMDYEVFLVSRIREAYLAHGDARAAIVDGVAATARVVTSAALIMVSVFGAFVLSNDVTTKLFGVGLAVAVLLDVTLVRMVLLPAVMSLLGERAWWLPRWLGAVLPGVELDGSTFPEDEPADAVPTPAMC